MAHSGGFVPFTLQPEEKEKLATLSGISVDSIISNERKNILEKIFYSRIADKRPCDFTNFFVLASRGRNIN